MGYGLVTIGPHLVIDNSSAFTGMTHQPFVSLGGSSGSSYIQDFSMEEGLNRLLKKEDDSFDKVWDEAISNAKMQKAGEQKAKA